MQVLRLLVGLKKDIFDAHLKDLVPNVCALLQTAGPTKLAAERTLARLLRVSLFSIFCSGSYIRPKQDPDYHLCFQCHIWVYGCYKLRLGIMLCSRQPVPPSWQPSAPLPACSEYVL